MKLCGPLVISSDVAETEMVPIIGGESSTPTITGEETVVDSPFRSVPFISREWFPNGKSEGIVT